ncbi:hypothetical protein QWA68_014837 [Fusarium oxysporum]|nr:hypothetical protein QWA68_014837 [Fusarium oxysporum]
MLCLQTCRGSEAVLHVSICGRVMERFLEILKTLDVLARLNRKLQTSLLEFGDWSVEVEDRRKFCLDVCQGLHVLHSCGIVHGDVKAENVLVFPNEKHKYKAKLSDFGYSLVMNTEKRSLSLGGTRPWKAPEVKTAVRVSDTKYTDIYSLSLLIWFTFAHGRNNFRLFLDPSKHGEEFYAQAEKRKKPEN